MRAVAGWVRGGAACGARGGRLRLLAHPRCVDHVGSDAARAPQLQNIVRQRVAKLRRRQHAAPHLVRVRVRVRVRLGLGLG